jgi:hypothetical protein
MVLIVHLAHCLTHLHGAGYTVYCFFCVALRHRLLQPSLHAPKWISSSQHVLDGMLLHVNIAWIFRCQPHKLHPSDQDIEYREKHQEKEGLHAPKTVLPLL